MPVLHVGTVKRGGNGDRDVRIFANVETGATAASAALDNSFPLVTVRFGFHYETHAVPLWHTNSGHAHVFRPREVAGLPASEAQELIDQGFATAV